MRLLIVAHGTTSELERAEALVNTCGTKSLRTLFAHADRLVDLDAVREHLSLVDAVLVVQCRRSGKPYADSTESELQRVERLTIAEACEAGKVVGVIGTPAGLLSKHMRRPAETVDIAVVVADKRDDSGAMADHFARAQVLYVGMVGSETQSISKAFLERNRKVA